MAYILQSGVKTTSTMLSKLLQIQHPFRFGIFFKLTSALKIGEIFTRSKKNSIIISSLITTEQSIQSLWNMHHSRVFPNIIRKREILEAERYSSIIVILISCKNVLQVTVKKKPRKGSNLIWD